MSMAGFFFIGVPMSSRSLVFIAGFFAMVMSVLCAVAGVLLPVCLIYFGVSLLVMIAVYHDRDFD
jgi:hypothetical protein